MAMQHLHNSLLNKVTPTRSFIASPLTPPPTDSKPTNVVLKVLDVFRRCRDGRQVSESQWHVYKIQPEEYDDFIGLVNKDRLLWPFVENKNKYNV